MEGHGEQAPVRIAIVRRSAGRVAGTRPYTPGMRRFVCVAALLFGFSGDRYAWTVRARMPVPIERPVALAEPGGTRRTLAWWQP
jgi:hypothetical protein